MIEHAKSRHSSVIVPSVAFGLSLLAATELAYGYRTSMPFSSHSAASALLPDEKIFTNSEDVSGLYGALFGVPAQDVQPVVKAVPPTAPPLPLMPRFGLTGVLGGANAMAVMVDQSGREQVYRVGEILPGGARLEAVMENAVQIGLGGASQIIRMEWEDTRSAGGNILPSAITGAQPSAVDPSADTTQQ